MYFFVESGECLWGIIHGGLISQCSKFVSSFVTLKKGFSSTFKAYLFVKFRKVLTWTCLAQDVESATRKRDFNRISQPRKRFKAL